jgi:hypothetical protein
MSKSLDITERFLLLGSLAAAYFHFVDPTILHEQHDETFFMWRILLDSLAH